MGGVENLFSVEPTLPNVQGHKMPENPDKWAEVLTTYLREQYPDTAGLHVVVEFRKKAEQDGTAIGSIHVSSAEVDNVVIVPFIIRKFMLSPLDIWMEPKTQDVHPMDKDTFKEQFFAQNFAEGTERPHGGPGSRLPGSVLDSASGGSPNTFDQNFPPAGKYALASVKYPLLDKLADTFHREEAAEFRKTLQDFPTLLLGFKKHGHADLIKDLASRHYKPAPDFSKLAMEAIPPGAISLKKEANDLFSLLSMSEGMMELSGAIRMNEHDCKEFLSRFVEEPKGIINDMKVGNEKTIQIRKPAAGVFLLDDMDDVPESAKDFGVYRVKTQSGVQENGVVIPHVVGFDGRRRNQKLFIGKSHYATQVSIAGLKIDDKDIVKKILKPEDIHTGQTGCFVYIEKDKAVATLPITISAIENYDEFIGTDSQGKKLRVRRGYGTHFGQEPASGKRMKGIYQEDDLRRGPTLESMGFAETRPGHYVIPSKMLWIHLGQDSKITETKNEWISKEAFSKLDADPIVMRWTGIVYDIEGSGLQKNAYDERTSDVLLANMGVPLEKIARAKKRARTLGKAKIHNAESLTNPDLKKEATKQRISKIAHTAHTLRRNLVKEAAEIEDSATVDTLLALNFLNAENMAKFAAYRQVFEKVSDYLAQLVLASRLGLREVSEAAAVSAMNKLQEVLEGLKKINVAMRRPSTKTASSKTPSADEVRQAMRDHSVKHAKASRETSDAKKKLESAERAAAEKAAKDSMKPQPPAKKAQPKKSTTTKTAAPAPNFGKGLASSGAQMAHAQKVQKLKDFAKSSPENAAKLKQALLSRIQTPRP
jgi:hypothetical protein